VYEQAADSSKPVVLYFVDADSEEVRAQITGQKVAEYSIDKAYFVIVPKPASEQVPSKDTGADAKSGEVTGGGKSASGGDAKEKEGKAAAVAVSPLPVDRLSAADLWAAYGVTKAGALTVADWYGNPVQSFTTTPKETQVVRALDTVADTVKQSVAKIDAEIKKIDAALEKDNDGAAMKAALRVFKMGQSGHKSVKSTVEKYNTLLARGRDKLQVLETQGDAAGLRKLKGDYRGSDLDAEIDAAVDRVANKA
jgi:hypothetical protein